MTTTGRADDIAAWFETERRARRRHVAPPEALAPADAAEAYAAQDALRAREAARRGPVIGRKIALTSKAMQEMVGFDRPAFGTLHATERRESPAEVRGADFVRLGLEFELALILAADAPPLDRPRTAEELAALVAEVRPAFELIEDRNADYSALSALALIVDGAWCGGVVLGPPLPGGPDLDLDALAGEVRENGEVVERVSTGAADPRGSFAKVLAHFGARGETLRAGEAVITGSAARTRFPAPGTRIAYAVGGLGAVEMTVV